MNDRTSSHLLLRADASRARGTGHVMRCLALGAAWRQDGAPVTLLSHELPHPLAEKARRMGVAVHPMSAAPGSLHDAAGTAKLATEHHAQWCVLDGYHFDRAFQERVLQEVPRVLLIDDYGSIDGYRCPVVLNQNLDADRNWYPRSTECLLGPHFALLRPSFARAARRARLVRQSARNVVITMGGADPDNLSAAMLEQLESRTPPLRIRVMVGAANPHEPSLRRLAERSRHSVRLVRGCRRMERQFAWADLVVSAAGSTVWEICCLGAPLATIPIVDNQVAIAQALQRRWPQIVLDPEDSASWGPTVGLLLANAKVRRTIGTELRQLVDGYGARRTADALKSIALGRAVAVP